MISKTLSRLALASLLPLSLAGCGGSSTGASSFEDLRDDGLALIARYDDADLTPVNRMPSSGSARYEGVAAFAEGEEIALDASNATVLSQVELTADFRTGRVSGGFDNFRSYYDGTTISGSIPISNGRIEDNIFTADAAGTLTSNGERGTVDAVLGGGFVNNDHGAVAGYVEGDFTDNRSGDSTFISGIFGAER